MPFRPLLAAWAVGVATLIGPSAQAQQPHVASFFPGGASAGKTVDIQIKGGNLIGVHGFLIGGDPGVTGEIVGGANAIDESARPVFQSKCTTCHEARSPENRSMSPEQWADTVKRMITQHSADIPVPDRDRIIGYLQGMAKAGQINARITVAPNAAPGMHEIRLVTDHGASSAITFEVGGKIPEMTAPAYKTGKPEEAAPVTLPIAVNGILTQAGERDWYRFNGKKGQRITFNLKAERLNAQSASFFFPTLHLYDLAGHEVAKSLGKYGVDPFIDYVVPTDADYLICVHDLLWHGNPSSVYRLTMGEIAADGILSPGWARPGATVSAHLVPATADDAVDAASQASFSIRVPMDADGMTNVSTPIGEAPLLVRDLPDGGGPNGSTSAHPIALPALFRGAIAQPGQVDAFTVHTARGGMALDLYAQRLGSPLHAQVVVRNSAGDVVAQRTSEGDTDFDLPGAFPRPGDYSVEISDADGAGGQGYLYCWEARDRTPELSYTATPDVVNLNPGCNMTLMVKAVRRRNLTVPVSLTLHGLPVGVTATEAVMLPDMNEAAIVLTAAPNAAGGTASLISVEARTIPDPVAAAKPGGVVTPIMTRPVAPLELYAVNNNQLFLPRSTLAVAIEAVAPPFRLTAGAGMTTLTIADNKDITIPVTVERLGGYKGALFVSVQGLPDGVSATQGTYNIPPNESKTTVTLRVNRGARYFTEKPIPGAPQVKFVIAGFVANINNDYIPTVTTPPITVTPQ